MNLEGVYGRLLQFPRLAYLYFRLVTRRFVLDGCQHSAAALTYMTLFALVPLLTVVYTVLSLVPSFAGLGQQIEAMIFANMLPATGTELYGYLSEFANQARLLSVPGILMLLITAYLMLVNIEKVFNRIWATPGPRRGINSFLVYWAVLSLGPLLLGAGLTINTYLLSLRIFTQDGELSGLLYAALGYLPWVMTAIAFTLLYKAVPNCQVLFRNAAIGGIVATVVFELAKVVFSLIVANAGFRNIYGAFSIIPLFLLWTYFCWMIVLGGAEFVRATETFATEAQGPLYKDRDALVMVLALFYRAQRGGLALTDRRVLAAGLSEQQWHRLRDRMLEKNLLAVTQSGRYMMARDMGRLTLAEVQEDMEVGTQRGSPVGYPRIQGADSSPEAESDAHFPWMPRYRKLMKQSYEAQGRILSVSLAGLFEQTEETED